MNANRSLSRGGGWVGLGLGLASGTGKSYGWTSNLKRLESFGDLGVSSLRGLFCAETDFNQPLIHLDTSDIVDISECFAEASSFNQPLVDRVDKYVGWDTSRVRTMREMFQGASSFNQPLEWWDTSKVTDMRHMFSGALKFNHPVGNWDVGQLRDAAWMFLGAVSFNQFLGQWDLQHVHCLDMFTGATAFDCKRNAPKNLTAFIESAPKRMCEEV